MCCGKGAACTGRGLTDQQLGELRAALSEAFGSPEAHARLRYDGSRFASMIRESREASAYWGEAFSCGADVRARGGSVTEYLACDTRRG